MMSEFRSRADASMRVEGGSTAGQDAPGPRQRVDEPHQATRQARPPQAGGLAEAPVPGESWLRLQAEDLIQRLQRWAAELDGWEADLRRRSEALDRQQRQLRVRRWRLAAERAAAPRDSGHGRPERPEH